MSATLSSATLRIDPEFRALIPPLTPYELRQLEENIQRDGCRDPLVLWNGILVDGHNRHEICGRLSLPFQTSEITLEDRDAAKAWIIRNQFGRRNLQPFQRAELTLQLEPLIAAKVKENLKTHTKQGYQKSDKAENTLAELSKVSGLSHDTIHKAKVIAEKASEEVKEKLRTGHPGVSIHKAYTAIKLQERDDEKKARLTAVVAVENPGLIIGDFQGKASCIPDESAELVFIDPPYDRGSESVGLYENAAREATRILKPGGSLIAYCGHVILFDVKQQMEKHLRYFWLNACVHTTTRAVRMNRYSIVTRWKPMLWFVKGARGTTNFVEDIVSGQREKTHHEWQQAESEASYYIENLTSPNGLVVDFFAGSGTTCVAAQRLGRPWIAFEIDPVTAKTADERIQAAQLAQMGAA